MVAIGTALMWAFTAIFFTLAGDRVGSLAVNRTRLVMAVVMLGAMHLFLFGTIVPVEATWHHWFWFGLSGIIGLMVGDGFLFQAYLDIGPRKGMLVMSAWPIFSAVMALVFLGETLGWVEITGIVITVGGIAWVILERGIDKAQARSERLGRGVLFAFGGAFCQAAGIVVAKRGLDGAISPLSGTLIRMIVAAGGIWLLTLVFGGMKESIGKLRDQKALAYTAFGAFCGPFLGVWMSLEAVDHAKVGVASALMALAPVLVLPMVRIVYGERVSYRAIFGTMATFAGVALLLTT